MAALIGDACLARRLSRHAGRPRLAAVLMVFHQGERLSTGEAASAARSSPPPLFPKPRQPGPRILAWGGLGASRAPGPAARTLAAAAAAVAAAQDGELCDENGELGPGEFENVMRQQAPPAPQSPAPARPSNAPAPQTHPPSLPLFSGSSRTRCGSIRRRLHLSNAASLKRPNPADAPTSSPYT